jgi:hypothetical protein
MQPHAQRACHVPEVAPTRDHVRQHVQLAIDGRAAGLFGQALSFVRFDVARHELRHDGAAVAEGWRGFKVREPRLERIDALVVRFIVALKCRGHFLERDAPSPRGRAVPLSAAVCRSRRIRFASW